MGKTTPSQLQRSTTGPAPIELRLLRRRDVTEAGCWEFLGAKDPKGYVTVGSISDGSRRVRKVHAVAFEVWVGKVPEGKELDHTCKNTSCFNPNHLQPVTHPVNIQRAYGEQGQCKRGHERTELYTQVDPKTGWRKCRVCEVARVKRRNASRSKT